MCIRDRTRINYCSEYVYGLKELLGLFGLIQEEERLQEVTYSHAKNILRSLLNRGIAYNEEFMTLEQAENYTNYLLEDFAENNCKCFSNGEWDKYRKTNHFGYNSMTKCTFDGGLIVTSTSYHFCFWVEEED